MKTEKTHCMRGCVRECEGDVCVFVSVVCGCGVVWEGLCGNHNDDCNDDVVDDEVVSMATATPSSAFELKFDFGGGIVAWQTTTWHERVLLTRKWHFGQSESSSSSSSSGDPACSWCLFLLACHKWGKTPHVAAHLCFYVHVWDHDENWRIKSTQPPSTKVSQRMTAFFFLLLLLLILCPPTRRRCCRFSWSIQQQHWQQQQLRRWQYHMTPECMSRTAFSIYCDASWISCGRPKFNCFVFFPAAPRSFSSFPHTLAHSKGAISNGNISWV